MPRPVDSCPYCTGPDYAPHDRTECAHTTGRREGQGNLAQVRAALDGFLGFVRGGYGNALCEEYQATLHRLAAKGDEAIHAAGKPAPTYDDGLREGLRQAASVLEHEEEKLKHTSHRDGLGMGDQLTESRLRAVRDELIRRADALNDAAPTEVTRG